MTDAAGSVNALRMWSASKASRAAIVVTGASGLLGANLAVSLRARGKQVLAVTNRYQLIASGIRSIQTDLTSPVGQHELFEGLQGGWIVHCAAATNVDWCEEHPEEAHRVNAWMTGQLAVRARLAGMRMAYVSTDSVFPGTNGSYGEEDDPAPVNVYARSKLAGEQAVLQASQENLVLRTNIYGWNLQEKESLAEWILHRLEARQPVHAFKDVFFTPILVNDLSEMILALMESKRSGVYHVAGSEAVSKFEFARHLASTFGYGTQTIQPVSVEDAGLKARRPRHLALRTSKAAAVLGRAMPDLRAGLSRFQHLLQSGFPKQLKALKG